MVNVFEPLIIRKDAPDFYFIIIENTSNRPDLQLVKWDTNVKRLRSLGSINTLVEMHELMDNSFKLIDTDLYFSPDFPEFLLPLDAAGSTGGIQVAPSVKQKVITWGCVRQEPGTMGGSPFSGTQEIKPRFREYVAVLSDTVKRWVVGEDTSNLESYGGIIKWLRVKAQCFDNLVQYNIWTKSNYEAETLTEWFQEYMDNYTGMFREAGINQLVFWRRVRDDTIVQMRNGYHVRSVLYYVRTERVSAYTEYPIKRIEVKINTIDLEQTVNRLKDHRIETSLYDAIVQKWVNMLNI